MKKRSIFWPLAMIATGVLWLLTGMGIVPSANLWALTHILPFVLIALGVGLVLRAYWRFAGMLVSLVVIAGAVMAVLYAPQFGWDKGPGASLDWGMFGIITKHGGGVAGSGVVETETRQLSEFNSIDFEYPAEIIIQQGKSESITITAEDNLLPQLGTEVRNGTLVFKTNEKEWSKRVNPSERILVSITVVELSEIDFSTAGTLQIESLITDSLDMTISGAGEITITDLEAGIFEFRLSGAGSIEVDGVVEKLEMRISGMGNFDGAELQSQDADVRISGAGSATVWVENQLDANISGAGAIDYYGSPEVSKSVSGAGSINKAGEK